MKRYRRLFAVSLAALAASIPFSACGAKENSREERLLPPAADLPADGRTLDPSLFPSDSSHSPDPSVTEPSDSSHSPDLSVTDPSVTDPSESSDPTAQTQTRRTAYLYVLADGLNVRAGAGTGYASLGQAEKGTLLKFAGSDGNWQETYYCGKTAYVSARYTDFCEMDLSDETTEKVIEEGLRCLGVPYVYGAVRLHDGTGRLLKGFSADAFDCSSLMQYIFFRGAGKLLDTTTRTQIKQGASVKKSEIRRGDLLFFTNASRKNKTGIERVGHVALYLGDNYILHTASDFAKIEQISETRWSYFIEARRML